MLCARMASAMPGARRVATVSVASGVVSRGEKPVPPVVRMRSSWRWSHRRMSAALSGPCSSASSSCSTTS